MTVKTRRLVFLAAFVLALTVPAETILLKALQTPDTKQAVREWVSGLDATALQIASSRIQSYPFVYRREIMRALTPDQRVAVWRWHIRNYLAQNSDAAAAEAIRSVAVLITSEAMAQPTPETRAAIHAAAEKAASVIGRSTAEYLFYDLGPKDGQFASAEPLSMKLANFVRNTVTLLARLPDCECNTGWGCSGYHRTCESGITCNSFDSWPACGWFWSETCDGMCVAGD